MSSDKYHIHNRYFQGAIAQIDPDDELKEFQLAKTSDSFVFEKKSLWNGGDGVEWIIERPRAYLKFQEKNVHMFLDVNPPEPPVNNLPPLQQMGCSGE